MLGFVINALLGVICAIFLKYNFALPLCFLILCVFIGLIIKTKKKVLIFILFFLVMYMIVGFDIPLIEDVINGECTIIEKHNSYYIVKYDHYKLLWYCDEDFNLYSKIHIEGSVKSLEINKSLNVRSFNDYLYTQGINYQIKADDYSIIYNGDILRKSIRNYLLSNLSAPSNEFIGLLVLGDKSSCKEFYESLSELGVVHLFVISGFHLNILYRFFNKTFKLKNDYLTIFLLIPYLYLLNFSLPVLRAFLFLLLKTINEKRKLNLSNLTILLIIALGFLLYDYHYLFNLSYQLTFITNIVIIILGNLSITTNIFYKVFIKSLLIQLSIFPIIILNNYEYSFMSLIFVILISIPIGFYYIFGMLTAIIKISDIIYEPLVLAFNNLINSFNGLNINLIFGKPTLIYCVLYYLFYISLIYMLITRNKKLVLGCAFSLLGILAFKYYEPYILQKEEVIFINVGQGDSTLIIGKNLKYSILIDTGGLNNIDTSEKYIIPLLKSKGIKHLDAIIITHDDYDHCGSLDSLETNYSCKKIYYGPNEYAITVNNFKITNLNHFYNSSSEDNEKSAVLEFVSNNRKFLIMGDATSIIEKKIIEDNTNLSCDILRIGHHGSNSSTSDEFIRTLNPKYAVISVGYNNYGHPTKNVLSILEKYHISTFRTDKDYNICFDKNNIIKKY